MMATAIRGQLPKNLMTARDLLETWALLLEAEQTRVSATALDQPITQVAGRLVHTIGTLHLYELTLPHGSSIEHDTPLSIIPPDDMEPTEGIVLGGQANLALVQTFDALGQSFADATVVPDRAGVLATSAMRLRDMLAQPDTYRLGPTDRLAPLLEATTGAGEFLGAGAGSSILTTVWADELSVRRQRLAVLAIELIRANKRILAVCPDHQAADALVGTIARAMKAVGLMYTTWVSRYEMALTQQVEGIGIQE